MESFDQYDLGPAMRGAIQDKGYTQPSPIQQLTIAPFIEGYDLIALAQTGTGKTAAFGIPMLELHHDDDRKGIVGLVLCPTRELAIQVAEELDALSKGTHIEVVTIYGGAGFGKQTDQLQRKATKIVVATPGRLIDFLQRGVAKLDKVSTLVLDEADRMLDMGFVRDMERIMDALPDDRQTALFSATMPAAVRKLSAKYLVDPIELEVPAETATADRVEQFYHRIERPEKMQALFHILNEENPEQAIVFTRTKHLAKRLADKLQKTGWAAVALQGNMTQGQRERALGAFRTSDARILVATDVAARGLDVPEVSHVFNFDLPDEPEAYVHRIGRTARMGREGRAITFVQSDQRREMLDIERSTGAKMSKLDISEIPGTPLPGPDVERVAALLRAKNQGAGMHPGRVRGGSKGRGAKGGGGGGGRGQGGRRRGGGRSGRSR